MANKKLYFHTPHNRRVRMVEGTKLNFNNKKIVRIAMAKKKTQDIKDITPSK